MESSNDSFCDTSTQVETSQTVVPLPSQHASLTRWNGEEDSLLIHGTNVALKGTLIPKGNYAKGLEVLDQVPDEFLHVENSSHSIQESRVRLAYLIHKIPKYRSLNEMLSIAEGTLYRQNCNTNKDFKIQNRLIDRAIELSDYFEGAREQYVTNKLTKYENNPNANIGVLKAKYQSRWTLMSNNKLRYYVEKYAKECKDSGSKPISLHSKIPQSSLLPQPIFEPPQPIFAFTQPSIFETPQSILETSQQTFEPSQNDESASFASSSQIFNESFANPIQSALPGPPGVKKSTGRPPKPAPLPNEPKGPPANPYALFTKYIVKTFPKNMTSKDRLTRVSTEWKASPEETREQYRKDLFDLRDQYVLDLSKFYLTLKSESDKSIFKIRHKSKMKDIMKLIEKSN